MRSILIGYGLLHVCDRVVHMAISIVRVIQISLIISRALFKGRKRCASDMYGPNDDGGGLPIVSCSSFVRLSTATSKIATRVI